MENLPIWQDSPLKLDALMLFLDLRKQDKKNTHLQTTPFKLGYCGTINLLLVAPNLPSREKLTWFKMASLIAESLKLKKEFDLISTLTICLMDFFTMVKQGNNTLQ